MGVVTVGGCGLGLAVTPPLSPAALQGIPPQRQGVLRGNHGYGGQAAAVFHGGLQL